MASWCAAQYARRKADGLCVECGGRMLPEWQSGVRCPDCAERAKERHAKYRRTKRGKATARRLHEATRAKYRAAHAARVKAKRWERKLAGLCIGCGDPALDDSVYCHFHREYHRAKQRKGGKAPARERQPVPEPRKVDIAPAPRLRSFDPIYDYRNGEVSLAEAATRYVELHNGIEARDVGDAFGADDHERNAISKALSRALASGRVTARGEGMERVFFPVRQRRAA